MPSRRHRRAHMPCTLNHQASLWPIYRAGPEVTARSSARPARAGVRCAAQLRQLNAYTDTDMTLQMWDSIPLETQPNIGNERSHYLIPQAAPHTVGGSNTSSDVILYRSGSQPFLFASVRTDINAGHAATSHACVCGRMRAHRRTRCLASSVPDQHSERRIQHQYRVSKRVRALYALLSVTIATVIFSPLPDGRVYLLSNAVFRSKARQTGQANPDLASQPSPPLSSRHHHRALSDLRRYASGTPSRSPLPKMVLVHLALTLNATLTSILTPSGLAFDQAVSVMSCTNLSSTSRCAPRYRPSPTSSGGKNPGTHSLMDIFRVTGRD